MFLHEVSQLVGLCKICCVLILIQMFLREAYKVTQINIIIMNNLCIHYILNLVLPTSALTNESESSEVFKKNPYT